MNELFAWQPLIIASAVGLASGSIGAFVILRRMALVGDALSHVALPGIGLALLYGFDPFWGVVVFLTAAAVIIWWLESRTALSGEALVGLLFTTSLAVGILAIPDEEIIHSLFGEFPALSPLAFFLTVGAALVAAIVVFISARSLLFRVASPDLASVSGISRVYDLVLLLIFTVVVSLGIKLVGTLLMGALAVIPAALAKNVAPSIRALLVSSAFFGVFISGGGLIIANTFSFLPGPTIILFGIGLFVVSLVIRFMATVSS